MSSQDCSYNYAEYKYLLQKPLIVMCQSCIESGIGLIKYSKLFHTIFSDRLIKGVNFRTFSKYFK